MTIPDDDFLEPDIDALFLKYCDGVLSAQELARLAQFVQNNPSARKEFMALCIQTAALVEQQAVARATRLAEDGVPQTALETPGGPVRSGRKWKFASSICLFAGLAAAIATIASRLTEPPAADPSRQLLATLTRSTGLVRIHNLAVDAPAASGVHIRSGDTVSTIGIDSSAELSFADGTAVVLSNNTEAMFEGAGAERIILRHGNLAAEVVAHPSEAPLKIATSEANVAVLGTQMLLSSEPGKTRVGVVEGKVRVTDPTEQVAMEMADGDQVEALGGELHRVPAQPIPDDVAFRFGPKNLNRWVNGHLVFNELLPGSTGAARTVPRLEKDGLTRFSMESENRWTSGMFRVHSDTWVSLRYRVEERGWFEMVIVARSHDIRHREGVVFGAPPDLLNCEPGVWRTVHYRLGDFRILNQPEVPSPLVGFVMALNSGTREIGLSVDQVWINRGNAPTPFPD
jgi:ferric-dicitrate binding protein FerR (iron transport regulator)